MAGVIVRWPAEQWKVMRCSCAWKHFSDASGDPWTADNEVLKRVDECHSIDSAHGISRQSLLCTIPSHQVTGVRSG